MPRCSFRSQDVLYSSLFSNFLLIYINCAMRLHCDVCTRPHDALCSYSHTGSPVMSAHVRVVHFAHIHTLALLRCLYTSVWCTLLIFTHIFSLISSLPFPFSSLDLFVPVQFHILFPHDFHRQRKIQDSWAHNLINSCSHHILQEIEIVFFMN